MIQKYMGLLRKLSEEYQKPIGQVLTDIIEIEGVYKRLENNKDFDLHRSYFLQSMGTLSEIYKQNQEVVVVMLEKLNNAQIQVEKKNGNDYMRGL